MLEKCFAIIILIFRNILNLEKSENRKRRKDTRQTQIPTHLNNFFLYTCVYNRKWSARFSNYRQRYPVVIPLSVRINLQNTRLAIHTYAQGKVVHNIELVTYLRIIEIRVGFFSVNTYLPKRNIFRIIKNDTCFFTFKSHSKVSHSSFHRYRIIINGIIISINNIC